MGGGVLETVEPPPALMMNTADLLLWTKERAKLNVASNWLERGIPWIPLNSVFVRVELAPRSKFIPRSLVRHTLDVHQGEAAIRVDEVWLKEIDPNSYLITNPFQFLLLANDHYPAQPLFPAYLPQTIDGCGIQQIWSHSSPGFPTFDFVPYTVQTLYNYTLGARSYPMLRKLKYESPYTVYCTSGWPAEMRACRTLFIAPHVGLIMEINYFDRYSYGERVNGTHSSTFYNRRPIDEYPELLPFASVAFGRPGRMEFETMLKAENILPCNASITQCLAIRYVFGKILEHFVMYDNLAIKVREELTEYLLSKGVSSSVAVEIINRAQVVLHAT
jgi:hypothetical protein